ncbi:hypothetical protein CUJ83_00935 [Methanocella sp. CWC-04]|uniref:Adhesin domain-containing protein n=1 Tax=Methanooceanicella nereidis TaxID=2052831 RepID=A0AAP2W5X8_9EURY|nr:hypothetical protein [Methanocella sp. CWC-04]MCD1293561.1 hypothetical protein [Methanocella sp. CWC-04]
MKTDRFLLLTGGILAFIIILILLYSAAFLCAIVTNIPSTDSSKMMEKDFVYTGNLTGFDYAELNVSNINGKITLIPGEDDDYTFEIHARGTEKEFERLVVDYRESDALGVKTLSLLIRDKMDDDLRFNDRLVSDITITLPANKTYNMLVFDVNGNINIGEFDCNRVISSTVNGRLTSEASAGYAELITVNGDVEVTTESTSGSILVTTVNGDILIYIPKNSEFYVDANTAVPKREPISINVPVETVTSNMFTLVGNSPGYDGTGLKIYANAVNGDIRIRGI